MPGSSGPLGDIRVIDLADESGAFAGRMLAQLGADVIRIEPPPGDPIRARSPFIDDPVAAAHGDAGAGTSLYHERVNAGKRSIVLDLASFDGREQLLRLATMADLAVLAGPTPSGVDVDALRAANPSLLVTSITPFGDGPLREYLGSDLVAAAASGLMYLNGMPEDPPQAPGGEQAYHMGSIAAVTASLVALVRRDRDPRGAGHRIEVSLQEAASMATLQTANANMYTWHGQIPRRVGLTGALGGRGLFECADGRWVSFTIPLNAPHLWQGFADWTREHGIGDRFEDERWADEAWRLARYGDLCEVIADLCAAAWTAPPSSRRVNAAGCSRWPSMMPPTCSRTSTSTPATSSRSVRAPLGARRCATPVRRSASLPGAARSRQRRDQTSTARPSRPNSRPQSRSSRACSRGQGTRRPRCPGRHPRRRFLLADRRPGHLADPVRLGRRRHQDRVGVAHRHDPPDGRATRGARHG